MSNNNWNHLFKWLLMELATTEGLSLTAYPEVVKD